MFPPPPQPPKKSWYLCLSKAFELFITHNYKLFSSLCISQWTFLKQKQQSLIPVSCNNANIFSLSLVCYVLLWRLICQCLRGTSPVSYILFRICVISYVPSSLITSYVSTRIMTGPVVSLQGTSIFNLSFLLSSNI